MNKLKPYPTWVCHECGWNATHKYPPANCTIHEDKCDVCGKIRGVTEPRDYGYPKFEGHEK